MLQVLNRLREQLAAEHTQQVNELTQGHEADLEERGQLMRATHNEALDALVSEHQKSVSDLQVRHREELTSVQSQSEVKDSQLADHRAKLVELSETHEQRVNTLSENWAKEKSDLEQDHQQAIRYF